VPTKPPPYLARPRQKRQDNRRGSRHERGYTSKWDRARLVWLRQHPLCAICEKEGLVTPATVVDHVVPHRGDMEAFWDAEHNWQSLCKRCHDMKTGQGK